MNRFCFLSLVIAICVAPNESSGIVVNTTTDEHFWASGLPGQPSFLLKLNDFDENVSAGPPDGINLGPLTVEATTSVVAGIDIDISSFFEIDGSPRLMLRTEADHGDHTEIRFHNPVRAFGVDVGGLSSTREGANIEFVSVFGDTITKPFDLTRKKFWGFISDEPITHVRFVGTNPDLRRDFGFNFAVDNLRGFVVPEPTVFALTAILICIALPIRRR